MRPDGANKREPVAGIQTAHPRLSKPLGLPIPEVFWRISQWALPLYQPQIDGAPDLVHKSPNLFVGALLQDIYPSRNYQPALQESKQYRTTRVGALHHGEADASRENAPDLRR